MKSAIPILKDPELQEKFDRDGFVKIKLLTPQKADELYQYFIDQQDAHNVVGGKYLSTTHTNDPELIRQVDRHLKQAVAPEMDLFFQNYEPMMCTYITKQPGPGSDTIFHQDPTFVDESRFVSANIWIALHDIDHENGNLFFVPGSHSFISTLRVTPDCPTAFDEVKDLLPENAVEVPVKKGEAILINHAVLHGATPNLSQGLRVAAVLAVRTAGSNWVYHYMERGASHDKIEKYEVDLETFISLKKDGRPENGKYVGYISWHFPQLSRKEFLQKTRHAPVESSVKGFFNKLSHVTESIFSSK